MQGRWRFRVVMRDCNGIYLTQKQNRFRLRRRVRMGVGERLCEYRREHRIIKRLSDNFPVTALRTADLADPKVREKIAEADVFSIFDPQHPTKCHVVESKKAMGLRNSPNPLAAGHLKVMVFGLDPRTRLLDEFMAALEQIKGRN